MKGQERIDRLRVGLLVDSLVQPAWLRRTVEEIRSSDIATIVLVAHKGAAAEPAGGGVARWYRNRAWLVYSVYMKLDRRHFGAPPDPFTPCDIAPLVGDVPRLTIVPRTTPLGEELSDDDVATLRKHRLDVALRLGFRALRGEVLTIARYGVWAYHHGDNRTRREGPAGFWEVMRGDPVTGSTLQRLSEEPGGDRVIYRSYANTNRISVTKNRLTYYWTSSTFVMRKLRDVQREGEAALADVEAERPAPPMHEERPGGAPRNVEMARLLARLAGRYLKLKAADTTQYLQWALAYRFSDAASTPADAAPDLAVHRFRVLRPPPDAAWADPFVAYVDGRHFILFEEYRYATGRGHIAAMEVATDGSCSPAIPVLVRDYHLSYPFLFEWRGEQYMIPESSDNNTVDLYRAARFPHDWRHERTLFAGRTLVDVTLQEIDGRWWLFANAPAVSEARYESWLWDELHLFYADSPLGPWTPHPRNPVVSDVRHARPAGRLFRRDGVWYRPAQDCAGGYGSRLAIQRIVRLDTERYVEVPATTLSGSWRKDIAGLHTVNAAAGLTVIDVHLRRWKNPLARLQRAESRAGFLPASVPALTAWRAR